METAPQDVFSKRNPPLRSVQCYDGQYYAAAQVEGQVWIAVQRQQAALRQEEAGKNRDRTDDLGYLQVHLQ